jgi:hypothetical protein
VEKDKSEKKKWWMFFLSFGSFSVMWFLLFYFLTKQIYHTKDAIFFGIPSSAYWAFFFIALVYGITTWGIYVFIKDGMKKKSFQEFKLNAKMLLKLAIFPILISLPFLYLGITNAVVINEEKIIFDTFWSFKNQEYFWDKDVSEVEIDYAMGIESYHETFQGEYIIHFDDGRKIDIWAGIFGGEVNTVEKIDSFVQKKDIPFFVKRAPSEETIDEFFNVKADFIRELYSR